MFNKSPNHRFFLFELTLFLKSQGAKLVASGCSMSIERWQYSVYVIGEYIGMIVETGEGYCFYDQQHASKVTDFNINDSLYRIETEYYEAFKI